MTFQIEAKDGYLKHTFTGLRKAFPNLMIHKIITETMVPLRVEIMRRTEDGGSGMLTESIRTYVLSAIQDIRNEIQEHANTIVFDPTTTLATRKARRAAYIARVLDKNNTSEIEVRTADFSHSDELLPPSDMSIHSITFNFEGNTDLDWAQPTPERVDHPVLREVVIALDKLVVEMSRSHSADDPRVIIADEAAQWISDIDNIYAVVEDYDPTTRVFHPTATSLNERENSFNADGSWDVPVTAGSTPGEATNTTRVDFNPANQKDPNLPAGSTQGLGPVVNTTK